MNQEPENQPKSAIPAIAALIITVAVLYGLAYIAKGIIQKPGAYNPDGEPIHSSPRY